MDAHDAAKPQGKPRINHQQTQDLEENHCQLSGWMSVRDLLPPAQTGAPVSNSCQRNFRCTPIAFSRNDTGKVRLWNTQQRANSQGGTLWHCHLASTATTVARPGTRDQDWPGSSCSRAGSHALAGECC